MAEIDLNKYRNAKILLVGDNADENQTISGFIEADGFKGIVTENVAYAIKLFEDKRPAIVVAAFDDVKDSQDFYLKLRETCPVFLDIKHKSLLLCKSNQAEKAFMLCNSGVFDDYVVSRPLQDPFRLRLSFFAALNSCSTQAELHDRAQQMQRVDKNIKTLADFMQSSALSDETKKEEAINTLTNFSNQLVTENQAFHDYLSAKSTGQNIQSSPSQAGAMLELMLLSLDLPLIMLIEDDKAYRRILAKVFPPTEFSVIEANDGLEALELLASQKPNLIFLDFMMPNLNGIETLKRIRADKTLKGIPVVMLAGASEKETVTDCIRSGAIDYIVKPGNRKIIMQKLSMHMKR